MNKKNDKKLIRNNKKVTFQNNCGIWKLEP